MCALIVDSLFANVIFVKCRNLFEKFVDIARATHHWTHSLSFSLSLSLSIFTEQGNRVMLVEAIYLQTIRNENVWP